MAVPDFGLVDKIAQFLSEIGIRTDSLEFADPSRSTSPFCFRFARDIADQRLNMRVVGEAELRRVTFYARCPIVIPSRKRRRIAEFLTRVNYGMSMATLEMDFSDGEVRCRSEIGYDGGELTYSQLRTLLYCSHVTMTTMTPMIEKVRQGVLNPIHADEYIRTLEGDNSGR